MVASWYFMWGYISMRPAGIYKSHDLMTYISRSTDFGQITKVKIFVQGRISINGCKFIFHMRMYLYETSRNIQETWPHDLYFTVHWLRTLAKVKIFVQVRISRPFNGSKLLFHLRMYICEISRNIQLMTSWSILHGLLTANFGWFSMVKIFVIGRFLSSTNGSKLIFYLRLYLCETSSICCHAKGSCSGVGVEVNI